MLIENFSPRIRTINDLQQINKITEIIIGAAIEVHKALGPGLLESAYETCLAFELIERGLKIEQQKALPVVYKDVKLDCGYRLDLIVNNSVHSMHSVVINSWR